MCSTTAYASMKSIEKSWISWSLNVYSSDFEILGGTGHKTCYSSPGMQALCIFCSSASSDYYEIHSFLLPDKMPWITFASPLLRFRVIRKLFRHNFKLCAIKYRYQKLWKFQKLYWPFIFFIDVMKKISWRPFGRRNQCNCIGF